MDDPSLSMINDSITQPTDFSWETFPAKLSVIRWFSLSNISSVETAKSRYIWRNYLPEAQNIDSYKQDCKGVDKIPTFTSAISVSPVRHILCLAITPENMSFLFDIN